MKKLWVCERCKRVVGGMFRARLHYIWSTHSTFRPFEPFAGVPDTEDAT